MCSYVRSYKSSNKRRYSKIEKLIRWSYCIFRWIKLPCLLVESKADLIDDSNAENCPELEQFWTNNGFCGSFRTSAKNGLNINEVMNYLTKNIIQRMEAMQTKKGEVFKTKRNVANLASEKHNEVATKRKQKDGCC